MLEIKYQLPMVFSRLTKTLLPTSGKNYNYGFGTKLEIKFRLTEDGMVLGNDGTKCADYLCSFPEMMMYGYLLMENWHWMLAELMEG